jgi:hypothetical protein
VWRWGDEEGAPEAPVEAFGDYGRGGADVREAAVALEDGGGAAEVAGWRGKGG